MLASSKEEGKSLWREPFTPLMVALFAYIFVILPGVAETEDLRIVVLLFFTALLFATLRALELSCRHGRKGSMFRWGVALALISFSAGCWQHASPGRDARFLQSVVAMIFFLMVAWVLLRRVLEGIIDATKLRGAICAYLLLGLAFASLFAGIHSLDSDAFAINTQRSTGSEVMAPDTTEPYLYTYYSFVVLSTLGFGDITPVSPLARGLTTLEAILGQLFLAVFVARLIGLAVVPEST